MIRIRREKPEEGGIYPCLRESVPPGPFEGRPARSQGRLFIRARCTRISLNALYIPRQSSSSSSSIVMLGEIPEWMTVSGILLRGIRYQFRILDLLIFHLVQGYHLIHKERDIDIHFLKKDEKEKKGCRYLIK